MKVGYARVSSSGQSLELQVEALTAAGCAKIYQEKQSGKTADDRRELQLAIDQLREGDELIVTRLDRLARSLIDLQQLVQVIAKKGAGFVCLHQGVVLDGTPTGKLMFGILGSFAEFERDLILDRQRDGIAAAKARGAYANVGRKRTISPKRAAAAVAEHGSVRKAAEALGVPRSTIGRASAEFNHHERSTDQ